MYKEPCTKTLELVLNFDWIMAIENNKKHIFYFNVIIWLYLIFKKISTNNIDFWQNIFN
jgi:hypothetical protein